MSEAILKRFRDPQNRKGIIPFPKHFLEALKWSVDDELIIIKTGEKVLIMRPFTFINLKNNFGTDITLRTAKITSFKNKKGFFTYRIILPRVMITQLKLQDNESITLDIIKNEYVEVKTA